MPDETNTRSAEKATVADVISFFSNFGSLGVFAWLLSSTTFDKGAVEVMILLPWLTVVVAHYFPDKFTVGIAKAKDDNRRSLATPWAIGLMNSFMLHQYVAFIEIWKVILLGLVFGCMLTGFALAFDPILGRRGLRVFVVPTLLFAGFYGYAAVVHVNILFDQSEPEIHQAVVSQRINPSRGSPLLVIEPWGPVLRSKAISVPYRVYSSSIAGGPVCLVQRSGRLGLEWYTAQTCPWSGERVLTKRPTW
jgi:hypothetical protein